MFPPPPHLSHTHKYTQAHTDLTVKNLLLLFRVSRLVGGQDELRAQACGSEGVSAFIYLISLSNPPAALAHLSSPRALASSFFHELLCLFLCFLLTNPSSCLFACISPPPPESVLLQTRPSLHFLSCDPGLGDLGIARLEPV